MRVLTHRSARVLDRLMELAQGDSQRLDRAFKQAQKGKPGEPVQLETVVNILAPAKDQEPADFEAAETAGS